MAKKKMMLRNIAMVLLIIGGLNWGLAVFNFNLVAWLLGTGVLAKIIYGLVGASALVVGYDELM